MILRHSSALFPWGGCAAKSLVSQPVAQAMLCSSFDREGRYFSRPCGQSLILLCCNPPQGECNGGGLSSLVNSLITISFSFSSLSLKVWGFFLLLNKTILLRKDLLIICCFLPCGLQT